MYRFDGSDGSLEHGGRSAKCGGGRGGWNKRELAAFIHDLEPSLPPRATARLNKAAMCALIRRLSRTEDLSDDHLDTRLADLDHFVRGLGFDDGGHTVSRLELSAETTAGGDHRCLPREAAGYRMKVMSPGQSGSAVASYTRDGHRSVVCKVSAVPPDTLDGTDLVDAIEGREAYMHARATRLLLLDRASPGVVAHGVSYLCARNAVKDALKLRGSARRSLALVTMMERGDRTLYDELRSGRLRHDDDHRRVLFRVLHALACWRHKMPGARHNDLHTQNVMMVRAPSQSHDVFRMAEDEVYYVPPATHVPALYDFGHAQAPGTPYPEYEGKHGMDAAEDGGYYDLHTLLSNLLYVVSRHKITLPPETEAFVGRALPQAVRVPRDESHGRMWPGRPSATSEQTRAFSRMARGEAARRLMRDDPFFAPYRELPPGGPPPAANFWRLD
jgi:hypothetical protein